MKKNEILNDNQVTNQVSNENLNDNQVTNQVSNENLNDNQSNGIETLRGFKFQTIRINQETKEEKVLKISGTFYYCEQVATQEIKSTLGLYKYEIRKVSKKDTLIVETITYDDELEIIVIK